MSCSVSSSWPDEGVDLAPLGGDLAGVGEVLVEVESAASPPTEVAQLLAHPVALLLELVAQHLLRRLGHGPSATAGPSPTALGSGRSALRPAPLRPGVGGVVDRPQPLRRHLRVHLRGREAGVAEQLLHHPDVGAVVEHVGRTRVAQHVREQAAPSPARSPAARTISHAPWRVSRPPRALRNSADSRAGRPTSSGRPVVR